MRVNFIKTCTVLGKLAKVHIDKVFHFVRESGTGHCFRNKMELSTRGDKRNFLTQKLVNLGIFYPTEAESLIYCIQG